MFVCVCVRGGGGVILFSLEHITHFNSVSRVLRGCVKGVSWVSQECLEGVSRVFQGCSIKDVLRVFQRY